MHMRACKHMSYIPHALNFLGGQNLKAHNEESEDSNNDSECDAFAEEMSSDWDYLISYN